MLVGLRAGGMVVCGDGVVYVEVVVHRIEGKSVLVLSLMYREDERGGNVVDGMDGIDICIPDSTNYKSTASGANKNAYILKRSQTPLPDIYGQFRTKK